VKNAALGLAVVALGVAPLAGCREDDASIAGTTQATSTRDDTPVAGTTSPTGAPSDCTLMQPGTNVRYLLCRSTPTDRGGFWFRGRGQIPIAYPYEAPGGQWSGGFLSGDTLLAQWTAECEVPFAFFVPARGGTPRLVTGERSLRNAPSSIAHGWTTSGQAIIEVIPTCNEARPGKSESEIWLISPDGQKRRLGKDAGGWTNYVPLDPAEEQ
jgi:hypothetical protein